MLHLLFELEPMTAQRSQTGSGLDALVWLCGPNVLDDVVARLKVGCARRVRAGDSLVRSLPEPVGIGTVVDVLLAVYLVLVRDMAEAGCRGARVGRRCGE